MRGDPARGVVVHHLREEILIERAPVHADAHRLVVLDGDLDDGAKVLIAPLAADVAGVDAILGERAGAVRILREQQMPVVVKVADDRDVHALVCEARDDLRDGRRRLVVVHRDAHELRAGCGERGDLGRGAGGVGGVGVRHRLHDDRMRRPDGDGADEGGDGRAARGEGHGVDGCEDFESYCDSPRAWSARAA